MKHILSLVLAAILLLSLLPTALAADPKPIPVLSEDERPATPNGIHYYMLICIDSWNSQKYLSGIMDKWSKDTGSNWNVHTDGMILVTVDEGVGRVMITGFNREMLIQRPEGPGHFGRLNNFLDEDGWAYENKKSAVEALNALVETLNSHLGLRIEKYIVVDFKMVENIIDAVGGVDINLTTHEKNRIQSYGISLPAQNPDGTYHLKGYAAVMYMRIRKVPTEKYQHDNGEVYADSDNHGRLYRDWKVLSTIASNLSSITYAEAMKLLNTIIANTVYTNMTQDDLFDALDLAMDLRGIPVERLNIPIEGTYEEFLYVGMATLQVDFEANREALHSFLFDNFIVVEDE